MITNHMDSEYTTNTLFNQIKEAIKNENKLFKNIRLKDLNDSSLIYFNTLTNELFSTTHVLERKEYINQYRGYIINLNYDIVFQKNVRDSYQLNIIQDQYNQLKTKKDIINTLNRFLANMYEQILNRKKGAYQRVCLEFESLSFIPLDFIISFTNEMKWNTDINKTDIYSLIKFALYQSDNDLNLKVEALTLFLKVYKHNGSQEIIEHKKTLEDLSNYINSVQDTLLTENMNDIFPVWISDTKMIKNLINLFDQNDMPNFKVFLLNYFKKNYKKPYNKTSSLILSTYDLVNKIKNDTDEVIVSFNPNISFAYQNKFKNIKVLYRLNDYDSLTSNKQLELNTKSIGGASIFVLKQEYEGFKNLVKFVVGTDDTGNENYTNYLPPQIKTFNQRFEDANKNGKIIFIDEINDLSNKNIVFI